MLGSHDRRQSDHECAHDHLFPTWRWPGVALVIMWTFDPNTLRRKRFLDVALSDLWMTRETLAGRYGEGSRRSGSA